MADQEEDEVAREAEEEKVENVEEGDAAKLWRPLGEVANVGRQSRHAAHGEGRGQADPGVRQ